MAKAMKALIRRGNFSHRVLFSLVTAAVALFAQLPIAHATKPVTYIVLDAASGQILNEHGADELNYPASLTKMMTLFLTFDALEHRQITFDSEFTVSRHASVQQPSKLGLMPGSTISIHDLILAVVTHSANDAAVVLAEGLAGSEADFAVRMNHEASILGMTRTNFRNASGLPDRFQYTTARDLSKLALALYRTFPKEYAYFATERFTYRGQTYGNHNHLMASFEGMDGIKTGFINASGFNLAASAVRDNRRLVGVIMGGRSAGSRDMEMAALLDDAFAHHGAASTMVASSDTAGSRLALRKADDLSPAATAETAPARVAELADAAEPPVKAAWTPRHHRTARHSGRRHVRLAMRHHGRRHGVVLASYVGDEQPTTPVVHHYRHGNRHSIRFERHIAERHHRHITHRLVVSSHHRASTHRYARLHHEHHAKFRHLVRAAAERRHGVACGGWGGNDRPCPRSLRPHRREALRSA
ncbi:MAG TPA: D-alanyl-D-alanine carboxypeptidase family protein [Stellaceae bacterium]|nr:D-alanyl-D-alanine carboxypeptidase family protein [Stellaceae bacterium]